MATHKVKEFSLGKITYRMPNVVECMRLLGQVGFSRDMKAPKKGQEFIFVSRLVDNLKPLIVKIEAEKDGSAISTWDDALEHLEFMGPLTQIATEVLGHLNPGKEAAKEKNG